ncbi:hypothetical protein ORI89_13270 [Sphingobacterium sp. UT-1RO-CII-1]|uniref:hypothetical protein n=1 Tax=Sphingobacterium sp. UT-1RO-CII-1 TaxID=2995225 RepID=UPI00227A6109|nr:hypothetical protein [Sphingobacterium sp. UT-1RO-CII-1]MCY4780624.1 hypothetical protein [Sphingobacterium sp. UT-1RO-CII-1]
MNIFKLMTIIGAFCTLAFMSCSNPTDDNRRNEQENLLPPPNGEDTRYNLDEVDTMVAPIDTNKRDTTNTNTESL